MAEDNIVGYAMDPIFVDLEIFACVLKVVPTQIEIFQTMPGAQQSLVVLLVLTECSGPDVSRISFITDVVKSRHCTCDF